MRCLTVLKRKDGRDAFKYCSVSIYNLSLCPSS